MMEYRRRSTPRVASTLAIDDRYDGKHGSKRNFSTVSSSSPSGVFTPNNVDLVQCSRWRRKQEGRRSFSAPQDRKWVFSSRNLSKFEDKIVIVSYNILGDENVSKHPDLYHKVPREFLFWERRKILLCEEIKNYSPQIICLQEVDRFNDLKRIFKKNGFRSVFKARTGDTRDGCAIFWKNTHVSLLHHEDMEFRQFDLRDNVAQFCVFDMDLKGVDTNTRARSLHVSSRRRLIVGNIHILFNPNRGDVKLGQVRLFIDRAHRLSEEWGSIPVILAGDLNSLPQSAIYQFVASSKIDILSHNRRELSGQITKKPASDKSKLQEHVLVDSTRHNRGKFSCEIGNNFQEHKIGAPSKEYTSRHNHREIPGQILNKYMYNKIEVQEHEESGRRVVMGWDRSEMMLATGKEGSSCISNGLTLFSAYSGVPGDDDTRHESGEPLVTSCHSKFEGTVDYIWHTRGLEPVRVLDTLPAITLRNMGGLPNKELGSDHLALVCELAFVGDYNPNEEQHS